jgi:hypothetical protein
MTSVEIPISFVRQYTGPFDVTSVFASLSDLNAYIASDPTSYAGQIVSVSSGVDAGIYIVSENNDVAIKQATSLESYTQTEVNAKITEVNNMLAGYVQTTVTLNQNGVPVTGKILFKAD